MDGLTASIALASSMSGGLDVIVFHKACKSAALAAVSRRAGEQARAMGYDIAAHLDVRVEATDSCARHVTPDTKPDVNGLTLRRMYFVRLALNSVPSVDHKDTVLGALVVADSFARACTSSCPVPRLKQPLLVLTR